MQISHLPLSLLRGRLAAAVCDAAGRPLQDFRWSPNSIQFGAADAVGKLLTGDTRYAPAGMYIQYVNNMGAWSTPTDYGRDAKAYFHTLSGGNTDILRVPLLVTPSADSSSDSLYDTNRVTFLAQTAGVDGAAGLIQPAVTFQRGVSTVVGGGLIAMPDADDYTKDVILTRGYLEDALERPADPHEVLLRWQVILS